MGTQHPPSRVRQAADGTVALLRPRGLRRRTAIRGRTGRPRRPRGRRLLACERSQHRHQTFRGRSPGCATVGRLRQQGGRRTGRASANSVQDRVAVGAPRRPGAPPSSPAGAPGRRGARRPTRPGRPLLQREGGRTVCAAGRRSTRRVLRSRQRLFLAAHHEVAAPCGGPPVHPAHIVAGTVGARHGPPSARWARGGPRSVRGRRTGQWHGRKSTVRGNTRSGVSGSRGVAGRSPADR